MSNLGIGVMLHWLSSNEPTVTAVKSALNKKIKSVKLEGERLKFIFDDDSTLQLWDDGQSCCESRYMSTDDDITYYIGAKLTGFELKEAPEIENEWGSHEVQFLEVQTDKGVFTISSHNEHNGYYGGFAIVASV